VNVYELEIALLDIEPRIWRRVAVPADLTLADLHRVIQMAMGWYDLHLHQFVAADGARYEAHNPEIDPDGPSSGVRDVRKVRLGDLLGSPGDALRYDYDFGDGWEHRVELIAVRPSVGGEQLPRCLAGERAHPPEDCGGPWGYQELLEALADPKHERHDELTQWLDGYESVGFDPEAFDIEAGNERLRSSPAP
jgi:hypothetical protein